MRACTIVLPVFNGFEVLRDCLASLDCHVDGNTDVLVLDDASTDAKIVPLLQQWVGAKSARRHLLRNESNLGFVATVNRGMAQCPDHDVLLLNSDTIVTPNWLERIKSCAASDARIATITPWSNNAEICSLPNFVQNNPAPSNPDAIAEAIAMIASRTYPELPTAVGFCMWIARDCLDQVGDFDQATFGRGYGEENDFCLRAAALGWRNVLCDDAYVVHRGGASFSATGEKPGGENLKRLLARYPGYHATVARFIETDPLRPIRERINTALNWF